MRSDRPRTAQRGGRTRAHRRIDRLARRSSSATSHTCVYGVVEVVEVEVVCEEEQGTAAVAETPFIGGAGSGTAAAAVGGLVAAVASDGVAIVGSAGRGWSWWAAPAV
eukprot:ctg_1640.g306